VKTKTMTKQQVSIFLAKDEASDVLEPIVDCLLAKGLVQAQILDALTDSVKRSLKISLSDEGVTLSVAQFNAEAEGIAKALIDRLTVNDPARVPPVAKRRGRPAAVAAW